MSRDLNVRDSYLAVRDHLIANPNLTVVLERFATSLVEETLFAMIEDSIRDYDEASWLYPFWQNYPPEERGRLPRGDQFPWIEVGEHAVGVKLARELGRKLIVEDTGFPTGPDQRFLVRDSRILDLSNDLIDAIWITADIKSAGPRDDFAHTVMSPNQISGSGNWEAANGGVTNNLMSATGTRSSHPYQPMLPPLIVLSDGTVALTVTMAIKPVYGMEPLGDSGEWLGQTLRRLHLLTIPNGLLLDVNPGYLRLHPGLLFPGKDDASIPLRRKRARVSIEKLNEIATWRHKVIWDATA